MFTIFFMTKPTIKFQLWKNSIYGIKATHIIWNPWMIPFTCHFMILLNYMSFDVICFSWNAFSLLLQFLYRVFHTAQLQSAVYTTQGLTKISLKNIQAYMYLQKIFISVLNYQYILNISIQFIYLFIYFWNLKISTASNTIFYNTTSSTLLLAGFFQYWLSFCSLQLNIWGLSLPGIVERLQIEIIL